MRHLDQSTGFISGRNEEILTLAEDIAIPGSIPQVCKGKNRHIIL